MWVIVDNVYGMTQLVTGEKTNYHFHRYESGGAYLLPVFVFDAWTTYFLGALRSTRPSPWFSPVSGVPLLRIIVEQKWGKLVKD